MTSQPAVTKPATQQPRPATDPQLRATILLLAATAGTRAASERYGVGEGTIRSWKARDRRKREIVAPGGWLTKHGGDSPAQISKRAKHVHRALLAAAPWLSEDKFLPAVSIYLRSAARSELLDEYIARVSAEKGIEHVTARTLEQATAASNRAFKQGGDLGLTPAGHSKLKLLVAGAAGAEDGIAKLIREGAEAREAREAAIDTTAEEAT
ncbi:MAG TPA: hypothetical protein VFC30_06595 [Solirubrobacteraceae bacterium]|nr:hypothetical protein [Solirubrobacteraceae bacterium]